jgi:hypothetical protein
MIDYFKELGGSVLLYSTPAFYVLSFVMAAGFFCASQMYSMWTRLLGASCLVVLIIIVIGDFPFLSTEFYAQSKDKLGIYQQRKATPNRWDFPKEERIAVFFLKQDAEVENCQFSEPMQLKSMKAGFYMPIGSSYDALLYKKAPYKFTLKIRSKETGHILIATELYFKQPLIFRHHDVAYMLEYQHTDGVSSVVQTLKAQCQFKETV